MRVLVITDWPALEAGTERTVELVIAGLRERGDDVRLLTTSAGSAAAGTADYVAYGTSTPALQAGLQVVNPHAVATVRRAVREFRPDVVHLNMFLNHLSPAILGPLRDTRVVMVVHDYKATCPNQLRTLPDGSFCEQPAGAVCRTGGCVSSLRWARDLPRYGLLRRGLRNVDDVVAISRVVRDELMRDGIVAPVIPQPVAPPPAGHVRTPADRPTFIYGGRLAPVKGVDVLLHAFARVVDACPDAQLEIYGDGPDRDATVLLAYRLGLAGSVEFNLGMPRDWTDAIGPAWALVAPSTYLEPFGIVAVEAITRGVPVIATGPRSGFCETVDDGVSGAIVAPGSVDELAAAMMEVATSDDAPTVPAAVADEVRERHDPDRHATALHVLLEPVAAEPPATVAAL